MKSEDAYCFIRVFEEVCLMMKIPQLGEDTVRLRFIPFVLKDLAKKWLYSLAVGLISSWDDFVKIFLKNFTQSIRPLSSKKISCSSNRSLTNYFENALSALRTYLPSVPTMT